MLTVLCMDSMEDKTYGLVILSQKYEIKIGRLLVLPYNLMNASNFKLACIDWIIRKTITRHGSWWLIRIMCSNYMILIETHDYAYWHKMTTWTPCVENKFANTEYIFLIPLHYHHSSLGRMLLILIPTIMLRSN